MNHDIFNILKIKKLFSFRKKSEDGFGMMEIIISIGIIVVGTVSITSLFVLNIRNEIRNRNKLIAIYLAQEQIEVIRKIRDDEWFRGSTDPALDAIDEVNTTIVLNNKDDPMEGWRLFNAVGFGQAKKVYINRANGYYGQSSGQSPDVDLSTIPLEWEKTIFQRSVKLDKNEGDCDVLSCMRIISTVNFNNYEVKILAYIYGEWYK
ncbi:MAG: hypothetical protein P1P85_03465 [Patescibacteria group bacterium]|nr:hypothetical protein [Patescibacteria group bacterium]